MMLVPLTQGRFASVDAADWAAVMQFKWSFQVRDRRCYAARKVGRKNQYLHKFLMPGRGMIDHRDGDGLNNQRNNLRPANDSTNQQGFQRKRAGSSSKFRGVRWHSQGKKWQARLTLNKKEIYIGLFSSEEAAARAYDKAAREHFGEFATPNF